MSQTAPPKTQFLSVPAEAESKTSVGSRAVRRFFRQPTAVLALAWVAIVAIAAVFAPFLAPFDPLQTNYTPEGVLQGPNAEHWLGTDDAGRDVLSRIIFGARIALMVGLGSVTVAMLIGVPIGLLLGYRGGWYDRIGTRFIDIFDALPGMLVAFAVIAILGRELYAIVFAVGAIFIMNFARMARAITLAERGKLYVDAAKVSGITERAIIFRQILPNLIGPLVIQGAILTGAAIIIESMLSFVGIGLQSSVPSWGGLLGLAAAQIGVQPFLAIPPGVVIVLTVLSFNLVGDGINDTLAGDKRKRIKPVRRVRSERAPLAPVAPAAPFPAADQAGAAAVAAPSAAPAGAAPRLEIRGLHVGLSTPSGQTPLVRDVSLTIGRGEIVGLLGESGSGKSMLARAILGLLPPGIGISGGSIRLDGEDIAGLGEKDLRDIRGVRLAAVFQDPMASLSPVHTIGKQVMEPLRVHFKMNKKQAQERAVELLTRVGVAHAETRLKDYPHQFSGGMAQRVAIAIALASKPDIIIADEATSALDVTTQAQVLDLLLDLRDELGLSILLITHGLGVAAEACDRVAVMYAGEIVEVAEVGELFEAPKHPYTAALLSANPTRSDAGDKLPTIPGVVPLAGQWPVGCHFASRCQFAIDACTVAAIPMVDGSRCIRTTELTLEVAQ